MADEPDNTEKTEEPTQKRLDEALQRSDVVKSQEVNTCFVIAGATLVLMAFSGGMSSELTTTMRGLIANAHNKYKYERAGAAVAVREDRR